MVDAIAQWTVRKKFAQSYPEEAGIDAIRAHAEKMKIAADSRGALARAVTTAVRADARQGTTREYYGRIASEPALTAVTICEREHFITSDPDRLLDGTFTVLGTVVSELESDVPTFARNKLLRNFSTEAFDQIVNEMHSTLSDGQRIAGMKPDEFLDIKVESRIRGESLRVLPLAIFS